MSRYRFGVWGLGLDDEEFAFAVAGAGHVRDVDAQRAEWAAPALPPAISADDAAGMGELLQRRGAQIAVTNPGDLDPLWLASVLQRANGNSGVYLLRDAPDVPVAWQWPLRIGLFADDRGSELRTALAGTPLEKLVELIEIRDEAVTCELLLIPCNLRTAVERLLAAKAPISADCTIVLGGPKVAAERVLSLMNVIRDDIRTAGVALASVPKAKREQWMTGLIAHLSHSATIDAALARVANEIDIAAPVVVCSRRLAEAATLRNFASRLETAVRSAPRMERYESVLVTMSAPDYTREGGGATDIVEAVRQINEGMAMELKIPGVDEPSMVPAPAKPLPDRFVNSTFFDASKEHEVKALQKQTAYNLRVHIGPPVREGTTANVAVDESKLPQNVESYELVIALFELPDDDHEPKSPPARATVRMPANKALPSEYAWFPIFTPARGTFTARVVVLHETRVLQTLLLRAPLESKKITLTQENIIAPAFHIPANRTPFDAALVVNKAGGKAAVMGVTAKSVAYNEPRNLEDSIRQIGEVINELTTLQEKVKLEDREFIDVMIKLARHGKLLYDWLAEKLPPELATAERIQLVEARAGAFLPIEFVYTSYAPNDGAKLCAHGKKEMAAPRKTKCPNERDRDQLCLSAFWGFSRVIERWPDMEIADNRDYQLSIPKAGKTKIEPLVCALVGASSRVNANDVKSMQKSIKPLLKKDLQLVAKWKEWPKAIEQHAPSMLILFPHSEEQSGMAALEVGGEFLQVASLEPDYVRPEGRDPGPVVLLLGCSTTMPRIAFHNFVSRFRKKGAALVVGTLSLIRGRHATRFVKEFLTALDEKSKKKNAAFGDVLLETKQAMLAAGDPFAITLVAYGDTDWRIS